VCGANIEIEIPNRKEAGWEKEKKENREIEEKTLSFRRNFLKCCTAFENKKDSFRMTASDECEKRIERCVSLNNS